MLNWLTTRHDYEIALAIAHRAVRLCAQYGVQMDAEFPRYVYMDVLAVHLNDRPLRLGDLLNADDNSFSHDVFGIRRSIDRSTGKLMNGFTPRFAR